MCETEYCCHLSVILCKKLPLKCTLPSLFLTVVIIFSRVLSMPIDTCFKTCQVIQHNNFYILLVKMQNVLSLYMETTTFKACYNKSKSYPSPSSSTTSNNTFAPSKWRPPTYVSMNWDVGTTWRTNSLLLIKPFTIISYSNRSCDSCWHYS